MTSWVCDVESGGNDSNGLSARRERSTVRCRVDTKRETTDNRDTSLCKGRCELVCIRYAVRGCGSGPDDRDTLSR